MQFPVSMRMLISLVLAVSLCLGTGTLLCGCDPNRVYDAAFGEDRPDVPIAPNPRKWNEDEHTPAQNFAHNARKDVVEVIENKEATDEVEEDGEDSSSETALPLRAIKETTYARQLGKIFSDIVGVIIQRPFQRVKNIDTSYEPVLVSGPADRLIDSRLVRHTLPDNLHIEGGVGRGQSYLSAA